MSSLNTGHGRAIDEGIRINKKGIFFTFIVFLLVAAILAAEIGINRASAQQKNANIDETAFNAVDNSFQNIYNEILSIKTGYQGRLQARALAPFDYDSGNIECSAENPLCNCTDSPNGCGWITISQAVPQQETVLNETYDALNLYELFVSSEKDLIINAEAAKNGNWGTGGSDILKYLVLPQCISYLPEPKDISGKYGLFVSGTGKCNYSSADAAGIREIDLDIEIDKKIEIDEIKINSTGGRGDLSDNEEHEFSGIDSMPFVKIHVFAPNCLPNSKCNDSCCLEEKEIIVSNHVGFENENGFVIKADKEYGFFVLANEFLGVEPKILIGTGFEPEFADEMKITAKITFKEPIENVFFDAFDFDVSKPGFENLKIGTG